MDELCKGLPAQPAVNAEFAGLGAMDAAAVKKTKGQGFVFEHMGKAVGCGVLKGGVEVKRPRRRARSRAAGSSLLLCCLPSPLLRLTLHRHPPLPA